MMKVMMTPPEYSSNPLDPDDDFESVMRDTHGMINFRKAIHSLQTVGCLPDIVDVSKVTNPVIKRMHENKVVSINMARGTAGNLADWGEFEYEPQGIMDTMIEHGSTEIDKACGLPLDEHVLRYASDQTGIYL